jgi:hypothetical protein
MVTKSDVVSAVMRLLRGRRWECPRCHTKVPQTVGTCPECGWFEEGGAENLEAHALWLSWRGDRAQPRGP